MSVKKKVAKKKTAGELAEDAASGKLSEFVTRTSPLEELNAFLICDQRTMAVFCECHLRAETLVKMGTTDVPLDPDEQADYRANRDVVEDHYAFQQMKDDAVGKRAFSNIVAEYNTDFDEEHPIKIIGGQHRFEAIKHAYDRSKVNEWHGVKMYVNLDTDQRLDVQLISNRNIAVSRDLFDRMQETAHGPALRNWCQEVGLLPAKTDFADRKAGASAISVQMARTFITNFYLGKNVAAKDFQTTDTTPTLCPTGQQDADWETVRSTDGVWEDAELKTAGKEFALLVKAQQKAFAGASPKPKRDLPDKALNMAVLSGWAYVAGMLSSNKKRLSRHYDLKKSAGKDPLNAKALAKGRHKTDAENYRGLGYRTDPKERGRFVELFYLQAEDGAGITTKVINVAIAQFHAKQATLEVLKAKSK